MQSSFSNKIIYLLHFIYEYMFTHICMYVCTYLFRLRIFYLNYSNYYFLTDTHNFTILFIFPLEKLHFFHDKIIFMRFMKFHNILWQLTCHGATERHKSGRWHFYYTFITLLFFHYRHTLEYTYIWNYDYYLPCLTSGAASRQPGVIEIVWRVVRSMIAWGAHNFDKTFTCFDRSILCKFVYIYIHEKLFKNT